MHSNTFPTESRNCVENCIANIYFSNAFPEPNEAIFGQDFCLLKVFTTDSVSGPYTEPFLRKLFVSRNVASSACNFRLSLWDFSAARKDFGLTIWRWSSLKLPLPGIKMHEQNPIDERYRKPMIYVDFVTHDFGSSLFAKWPDRGECFAPFSIRN